MKPGIFSGTEKIANKHFLYVLTHIVTCYAKFLENEKFSENTSEDEFRNVLYEKYLNKYRVTPIAQQFLFQIESAEVTNEFKGNVYCDIRVLHKKTFEDCNYYFNLECKRLDGENELNKKYVTKGIYRFLSGHYTLNNKLGGMIGFVIKGDIEKIILGISQEVKQNYDKNTSVNLKKQKISTNFDYSYISNHSHIAEKKNIKLYHLMLNMKSILN